MRAELLAVGSELLTPLRSDTNGTFLTRKLLELGIEVVARTIVADEAGLLESAFRAALSRADVVIATGGLGPTQDDLTREAAAAAVGRRLSRDPEIVEELKARFASFGRSMAPVNEKQADVIAEATILPNPRGTAPGQRLEVGNRRLVLLPGPPREMGPMFEEQVLPWLRRHATGEVVRTRILRIASMSESDVDQIVAPLYTTFTNPTTTILSGPGQIELHLTARGASHSDAEERIEALAVGIRERLGGRVFSEDGRGLNEVVVGLLRERGLRLTLAESCTGGSLAACLTEVPGSSACFERGYVTYSNESKLELLGVLPAQIESEGAVSEAVARSMAAGAMARARAEVALGITGIAGPEGGTAQKPVGLVYVALEGAAGRRVRKLQLPGDRGQIRQRATRAALEMLRRGLLALESP